ncbi:MAG: DNA-methyltransferase [Bacillota bacterium]
MNRGEGVHHRFYLGDALDVLTGLETGSADCMVTSPPYWNLRDYGTATWAGGDPACDHRPGKSPGMFTSAPGGGGSDFENLREVFSSWCEVCGARRLDRQVGIEATPEMYVTRLVGVFREARRVLRPGRTFWLVVDDCYARNGGTAGGGNRRLIQLEGVQKRMCGIPELHRYKPKDLLGIPWLLALSLRNDGWYLRSDIIWRKTNCLPESVTDRPTREHEYLFRFSKSERYYYDADSIREPYAADSLARTRRGRGKKHKYSDGGPGNQSIASDLSSACSNPLGRNRRTVWTVETRPFSDDHFATYPPDLIKPCVLAGCPPGGTVLDPFGGSGTTTLVAMALGRHSIYIDLNPHYLEMALKRTGFKSGRLIDCHTFEVIGHSA